MSLLSARFDYNELLQYCQKRNVKDLGWINSWSENPPIEYTEAFEGGYLIIEASKDTRGSDHLIFIPELNAMYHVDSSD